MRNAEVYKDIEYMQILKNGKSKFVLKEDEINGKTKMEVQEIIGVRCGEGLYNYTLKEKGVHKNKSGRIRALTTNDHSKDDNNDSELLNHQIQALSDKINSIQKGNPNSSGVGFDQLLEVTKSSYQMRIDFLTNQYNDLKETNLKLNSKIEKLEAQLEEAGGEDGNNFMTMIESAMKLKSMFKGGSSGASGLADNVRSDPSDIPAEWLSALGKIDYKKISDEEKIKLVGIFNQFADQLPLKQNGVV